MVSVLQINNTNNTSKINNNKQLFKSNLRKSNNIQISNQSILNYMNLLGLRNAANITFGAGQENMRPVDTIAGTTVNVPRDGTWLYDPTRAMIELEAIKHIDGNAKWDIKELKPWMVSAETENFMPIGGLAKVAVDLPSAFNKKFFGSNEQMTVVTPLYINGKDIRVTQLDENRIYYERKNNKVQLEKMMDIEVPFFDISSYGGEMKKRKVAVYSGVPEGSNTKYIMFYDPDIFDLTKNENDPRAKAKNANCDGCYVTNSKNFDENIRFAFFSKAVYELAKKLKQQDSEETPNVMLMNDWHVGSLAPLLKYLAPAEQEGSGLDKETADYLYNMPSLFIAHNLAYQGAIWNGEHEKENSRTEVLGTLFDKYTKTILEHSKNHPYLPIEDKNVMFKYQSVNPGMMGLALADRVVPVSQNYGNEILKSAEIGKGMQNLMKIRNHQQTFTPITNGYSKDMVIPVESKINEWQNNINSDLLEGVKQLVVKTDDIKFRSYTVGEFLPLSETERADFIKEVKLENKKAMFEFLTRIITRERNSDSAESESLVDFKTKRRYVLYKPHETNLSDVNPETTPVMTFVGRVADQKGMDTIYKKAIIDFAKDFTADEYRPEHEKKYKGWEIPVTIIGGTLASRDSYLALESLKRELKEINPKFAQRMLLFKGYANTNFLALGSDFFLIPSKFEPCGLIQMEVMAKGVIPIATSTGGLVTTIADEEDGFLSSVFYDKDDPDYAYHGNSGYAIYRKNNEQFLPDTNWRGYQDAMKKALGTFFHNPEKLTKMQEKAMIKDFSWNVPNGPLDQYVNLMRNGSYIR